jgi:hypothetical protein
MKLTIKWIATIATVILFLNLFIDTVPSPENLQWSTDQITRALFLALYVIIVIIAIWSSTDKTWVGLIFKRKRVEQEAKIAEAEAQIAKYKKDSSDSESQIHGPL